ncbi:MAG: GNAT family N-acetyltransferase [Proteobacteria bacterium]|nr:GNAT family N-acetyltransferase [Pseudomonadota bacterium]
MAWPERIDGDGFILRAWRDEDAVALVAHADDARVAHSLGERFPHPYTPDDAHWFIANARQEGREKIYAIQINGEAAGSIGVTQGEGVERHSAELGYWVGRAYWGEGIATAAVRAIVPHALREWRLYRLYARVFADNPASMTVLERCGFAREAVLRRQVLKGERLLDLHIFAITRERLDATT